jgi:hypothetical protein
MGCGCKEGMDKLRREHPRLARAWEPVHDAAMKHLSENTRNQAGKVVRRVLMGRSSKGEENGA